MRPNPVKVGPLKVGPLKVIIAFALLVSACTPQEVVLWEWFMRSQEGGSPSGQLEAEPATNPKTGRPPSTLPGTGATWASPLPGAELLSPFGPRGDRLHKGTDIWCVEGQDPVRSVRSGVIAHTGTGTGFGRLVVVDHGDGMSSLYAHLDSIGVEVGERVDQGDEIAVCGRSGIKVSPAHLHVEIRGPQFSTGARDLEAYHSFLESSPIDPQGELNL